MKTTYTNHGTTHSSQPVPPTTTSILDILDQKLKEKTNEVVYCALSIGAGCISLMMLLILVALSREPAITFVSSF